MALSAVLDVSAVLTLLYREPGHEVEAELIDGSLISSVNWSDVTQKLAQRDVTDPAGVAVGLSPAEWL